MWAHSLYGSLCLFPALSGSLSGSLWLSIALRICLQSPCLAHKTLARLAASLRCNTLMWIVYPLTLVGIEHLRMGNVVEIMITVFQ